VLGGHSIFFSHHTDQADVGDGTLRAVIGATGDADLQLFCMSFCEYFSDFVCRKPAVYQAPRARRRAGACDDDRIVRKLGETFRQLEFFFAVQFNSVFEIDSQRCPFGLGGVGQVESLPRADVAVG